MKNFKTLFVLVFITNIAFAKSNYQNIKVFDIEGKEQTLNSSKDKLLVVLWATWCPDCKSKLKVELKNLKNNSSIEVLALNTEKNLKRVSEYIQEEAVTVPVAFDKQNEFRKSLELFTVPSWAVFDKQKDGSLVLIDKGSPFEVSKINIALGANVFAEKSL